MRKGAVVQLISIFALLALAEATTLDYKFVARVALPQEGPGRGPGAGGPGGPGKRQDPPGREGRPGPPGPPKAPQQPETTTSTTSTITTEPVSFTSSSTIPSIATTTASTVLSQAPVPTGIPLFTAQPIIDTTATPILVTSILISSSLPVQSSTPVTIPIPSLSIRPNPVTDNIPTTPSTPSITTIVSESTSSRAPSSLPRPPGTPIMSDSVQSKRTLVIVLSTVLGSVALLLGILAFFLVGRCQRRRLKSRGVTPIDDEEIESWRSTEKKLSLSVNTRSLEMNRTGTLIPLSPESERGAGLPPQSPDWGIWSVAQAIQSPPPTRSRGPSLVATMPNARIGLTTDTVPGAEPFVPVLKRQSSRLSRDRNHARSKSMRSSASAKSMRSLNGESVNGFDFTQNNEAYMPWLSYTNRNIADISTIGGSTPGTSIYVPSTESGGLSPRTKTPPLDALVLPTALSPRPEQRQFQSAQTSLVPPSGWPETWR